MKRLPADWVLEKYRKEISFKSGLFQPVLNHRCMWCICQDIWEQLSCTDHRIESVQLIVLMDIEAIVLQKGTFLDQVYNCSRKLANWLLGVQCVKKDS